MNEKEAWLFAAETWDGPDWPKHGLCTSISRMYKSELISRRVSDSMLVRVQNEPFHGLESDLYKWPRTSEGAKQRAQFCREQAAKC